MTEDHNSIPGLDLEPATREQLHRLVESSEWTMLKEITDKVRNRMKERLLDCEEDRHDIEVARVRALDEWMESIETMAEAEDNENEVGTMSQNLV